MSKLCFILITYLFTAVAFAVNDNGNAHSQKNGDLVIQSDKLTLNQTTKDSYFFGKVVVTQDDLLINSDDLLAHQDDQGQKYITLKGNPVHFKQLDKDGKWIYGQSDTIFYDTKTKIMILTGHAKVKKEGDLVIGQQIHYNTVTKIYDVNSLDANSRVTVILQDHNKSVPE